MPFQVAQINVGVTANSAQAVSEVNNLKTALQGMSGEVRQFTSYMLVSGQTLGPWMSGMYMVNQGLREMAQSANIVQAALLGVTTALGVVAALAIRFGAPIQQQQQMLKSALDANNSSWAEQAENVERAVQQGEHFGRSADDTYAALNELVTATHSAAQMNQLFGVTADLAAKRGITLAQAATIIARAMEGYGRSLQDLTSGYRFERANANAAEDAQNNLARATENVGRAQRRLTEDTARLAEKQGGTAVSNARALADANRALADAYQRIADQQARQAIDDMVPRILSETTATRALADAKARLAEDQAAIANRPEYRSKLVDETDKLTIAQIRLQQAQERQAVSAQGSQFDYKKLVDLQQGLAEAQQRLAMAQGSDIGDAQANLSDAIKRQRDELDQMHMTVNNTLADRASLIQAEMNVRDALLAVADARKADADQAAGTTPQQVSDRGRIEADNQAIADAQIELQRAVLVDAQTAASKILEDTIIQRDAVRSIEDAMRGVEDAQTAVGGGASSGAALRRQISEDIVALFDAEAAAALAAGQAIYAQNEAARVAAHNLYGILDVLGPAIAGQAEAAGKGWPSMLKRIIAQVKDFLGEHAAAINQAFLGILGLRAAWGFLSPVVGTILKPIGAALLGMMNTMGLTAGGTVTLSSAFAAIAVPVALAAAAVAGSLLVDHFVNKLPKAARDVVGVVALPFHEIAMGAKDAGRVVMDLAHGDFSAAFNDMGALVKHQATAGWHAMEDFWLRVGPMALDAGKTVLSAITGALDGMWDAVSTAFNAAKVVVLDTMKGAGSWLLNVGKDIIDGLWKGIKDNWTLLFTGQLKLLMWLLELVNNAYGWLFDVGVDIIKGLWNGIRQHWSDVFVAGFKLAAWLGELIIGAQAWLLGTGNDIIAGLWKGVSEHWTLLFTGGFKLMSWIIGLVPGAIGWLYDTGWQVLQGLWQGLMAFWEAFFRTGLNIGQWLKDKVGGFMGGAIHWLWDIGVDIVRGLWDGIKALWDDFIGWLGNMFTGGIIGKVAGWLGIKSPSNVFASIGNNMVLGLRNGMRDAFPEVHKVLDEELTRLTNLSPSMGGMAGLSAGRGGTIVVNNNQMDLHVAGSVQTEKDLVDTIRNGMIDSGRRQGGGYLAGVA